MTVAGAADEALVDPGSSATIMSRFPLGPGSTSSSPGRRGQRSLVYLRSDMEEEPLLLGTNDIVSLELMQRELRLELVVRGLVVLLLCGW